MRVIKQKAGAFPYMTSDEFAALCGLAGTLGCKNGEIIYKGKLIATREGNFNHNNLTFRTSLSSEDIINTLIGIFNEMYDTNDTHIQHTRDFGVRIKNKYYCSGSSCWGLPVPMENFKNRNLSIPMGTTIYYKDGEYKKFTVNTFMLKRSGITYGGKQVGTKTWYVSGIAECKLLKNADYKKEIVKLPFDLQERVIVLFADNTITTYSIEEIYILNRGQDMKCTLYPDKGSINIRIKTHNLESLILCDVNIPLNNIKNDINQNKDDIRQLRKEITLEIKALRELKALKVSKLLDKYIAIAGSFISNRIRKLLKTRRTKYHRITYLSDIYTTIELSNNIVYEDELKKVVKLEKLKDMVK